MLTYGEFWIHRSYIVDALYLFLTLYIFFKFPNTYKLDLLIFFDSYASPYQWKKWKAVFTRVPAPFLRTSSQLQLKSGIIQMSVGLYWQFQKGRQCRNVIANISDNFSQKSFISVLTFFALKKSTVIEWFLFAK